MAGDGDRIPSVARRRHGDGQEGCTTDEPRVDAHAIA
jgi:hypothetical protein